MPVDAAQAAGELRAKNAKIIIRAPEILKQVGTVHIWNVGPNSHTVGMGGLGSFTIPDCKPGHEVSKPLDIAKFFTETVHQDMQKMVELVSEGIEVAKSVVGIGKFQSKSSDLRRFGVFISADEKPSKEEIAAAKAQLYEWYLHLVDESNQFLQAG